ncbi:Flp pilus assembly protein RcpC/CpaB [hydrothermal vent metagenome]|uniref:Flp pilus assembly protein RcpC/CpaB n=1 Tax=hydrothermal vent metagenome TaxID=652676 RepID=A0A3B0RA27_9ZZZZ
MSIAKLAVLLIAAIAAIAAAFLVRNITNAPAVETVAAEPAVIEEPTSLVLVAGSDIQIGQRVTPGQLEWLEWPEKALNKTFLTQADNPQAMEDFAGSIARVQMAKNEPISSRKLIQAGDSGFMAAVLSPGMRAVAVEISVETGAGGFILPNDRVDIILTRELDVLEGSSITTVFVSDTVFKNVRVLAIDQTYRELDDEQVVIGSTATLELNAIDSENLARADASGDISLTLRSVSDVGYGQAGNSRSSGFLGDNDDQIKVYKYGKASQVGLQ